MLMLFVAPMVGSIQHRDRPTGKPNLSAPAPFGGTLWLGFGARRLGLYACRLGTLGRRRMPAGLLATRIDQYSHERVRPVVLALI